MRFNLKKKKMMKFLLNYVKSVIKQKVLNNLFNYIVVMMLAKNV